MDTQRQTILLIAVLLFLAALLLRQSPQTIQAQQPSLYNLLTTLNERVQKEGIIFTIVLANYASPEAQERTIGTDKDVISEIGIDYFCVNRLAGAALTKSCIPFTNIAAITLLDT